MSAKDKKSRTSHREFFVVSKDAPFQFVEAYKSLRTNLEFLSATSNCKTILITSSVPEEGKSYVAINLAITLAASNKRVVLVDCDMRKSAISRYLRIPRNHAGLTSVITARDVSKLAGCTAAPEETAALRCCPLVPFRRIRQNSSPPLL